MARLSVVVTSFNVEDYLDECLSSILGQTLDDLEVIVVDDGSTDTSPEIIRAHAARDPRVVPILLEENSVGGVATAANTGLDRATSPYVGFADGDDVYAPEMFERLLTAVEGHDADLAMCQYRLLDATDGTLSDPPDHARWVDLPCGYHELDERTRRMVLRFVAVPWRKVYRRSLLEDNGIRFPVGDHFYEDNAFHWFAVLSARSLVAVPEVLCHHRTSRTGQTMAAVDERLFEVFHHHHTVLEWLIEHDLDEQYRANLLAWAMGQMEWIARRTPKHLHPRFYERLHLVFARHDTATVDQALAERNNATMVRALTAAVRSENFTAFTRALDQGGVKPHPAVSLVYYLRHDGVRTASRLTVKYVRKRVDRIRRQLRARPPGIEQFEIEQDPSQDQDVAGGNDMASDELRLRLDEIGRRLAAIEGRVAAIERRVEQIATEERRHPERV